MLKSALLFSKKMPSSLEEYGFMTDPYDPCASNKNKGGYQMTVVWNVDDLKVSHKDLAEMTNLANYPSNMEI